MANIAPIRTSAEIATIINKAQHALADIGWEVVNEEKQGITVQDVYHRDKVYQLLLLDVMLKNILDENGNVIQYYQAATNEEKFNNILSGLLDLSKSFDGPAIPMLLARNSTLVFYPSTQSSTGAPSGGPATPGGTTFQNLSVNSPGATLDSFSANQSQFVFYIVSVVSAAGAARTSVMSGSWLGSNTPVYTETKTEDIAGSTSDFVLKIELSGGNIQLNAYTTTNGWSIQGLRILFQNISFNNALGPLPAGGTSDQLLKKNSNSDYDVSWFTLTVAALTDLMASVTELNYSQGVTSNIQAQINSIVTSLSNYLLKSGGSMSGAIAMGNNKITGLAAGTTNGEALRYEQVVGLYLLLSGGTMTGGLNMGGQSLTNLPTAVNPSDAVRFDQVPIVGSFTTSGLVMGSGWTNTSFRFKLLGTGEVKLDGWVTKASATNGDTAFTLPVGYRPSATKVFPIADFGFLSGPGFFASISTGGVCTITQNNWSSGGMVGSNYSFDSIVFSL